MSNASDEDKAIFNAADGKAEYDKCVDISTKASIREMVMPGLLAIIVPVAIGFGISQESHCKKLSKFADGLIVGSHFVKLMQDTSTVKEGIDAVCNRVKQFKAVL